MIDQQVYRLTALGYHVFPCESRGKRPLVKWKTEATADEATIEAWGARWPRCNWAVVTGARSGIVVVDVDPRNGGDIEALGPVKWCARVATGGGGMHFYVPLNGHPGFKGRNGVVKGVDVKADGGYVIIPPSRHHSGGAYRWLSAPWDGEVGPDEGIDAAGLAVICDDVRRKRYGARALKSETAKIIEASEGSRNDTLNTAAYAVGGLVATGYIDREVAHRALAAAGLATGLTTAEVEATVRSGLGSGIDAPRDPLGSPKATHDVGGDDDRPTGDPSGVDWPDRTAKGVPLASLRNAIAWVEAEWAERLAWDTLSDLATVDGGEFQDRHITDLRVAIPLQRLGASDAHDAIEAVARQRPVNPYLGWVGAWDGAPRLGSVATRYLGCEADDTLSNRLVRMWLIALAARVCNPGCEVHAAIVLEGSQGIGKTRWLRALGMAGERYYSWSRGFAGHDKIESLKSTRGKVVVEISELAGMRRSTVEAVKETLTECHDTYRDSYAKRAATRPRSFVFCGTTNDNDYLGDKTGGRRWWPIPCASIDLEAWDRDVRQVVAEAVEAYRSGEQWWPSDDETLKALDKRRQSRSINALADEEADEDILAGEVVAEAKRLLASGDNDYVMAYDLIHIVADGIPGRRESLRLARILLSAGWERLGQRRPKGRNSRPGKAWGPPPQSAEDAL